MGCPNTTRNGRRRVVAQTPTHTPPRSPSTLPKRRHQTLQHHHRYPCRLRRIQTLIATPPYAITSSYPASSQAICERPVGSTTEWRFDTVDACGVEQADE